MKVILLQDVAKIGKRSELVEVPDGYALNQLIPKKMAEPATAANQRRIERLQASAAADQAAGAEQFDAAMVALKEQTVTVTAEANEQGHLFKAVHENDVADAAKAAGISLQASHIVIAEPIKELGEHTLQLVSGDQKAEFIINVTQK